MKPNYFRSFLRESTGEPVFSASSKADVPSGAGQGQVLLLRARTVLRLLVGIAVVLVAIHLLVVWSYYSGWPFPGRSRFYMDSEANVPTFFSTVLLLVASMLLACIAGLARADGDRFAMHWKVLALIFLAMALDETTTLHERLIDPLRNAFHLSGVLYFSWVLVGAPFVLVVAIAYLRFLRSLPAGVAVRFLTAGALYVGGALGLELLGGHLFVEGEVPGPNLLPYMLAASAEETLEITGVLVFIASLLRHMREHYPLATLRIG